MSRIRSIVRAYDSPIVRAYASARFVILRQRFLSEIGQYLPERGRVLDVGCGFGLFALYFAIGAPDLEIQGVDHDETRVRAARRTAAKLGVGNARFDHGDAQQLEIRDDLDGAYMLDILHHIPRRTVPVLVSRVLARLRAGGVLVVKDVDTRPRGALAFTWALDKLVKPRAALDYWSQEEVLAMLRDAGLEVYCHAMVDYLPYPHRLYIGWKT